MGDLVGVETLQIGEEEDLLERIEIQEEEMETLILMMMTGVDLCPRQILHCLGEEGIGGPSMFMYCKDLQDTE